MRILFKLLLATFITLPNLLAAQETKVLSATPGQDAIGVSRSMPIVVKINKSIDSVDYDANSLFQIYGSNNGLVNGTTETGTDEFIFIPDSPFFCGEVINVSFGPIISGSDSSKISFNWRFTVEITNQTNANFDSLKRFDYPSFDAIAIDYNNDGAIDIVSATGRVIFNDGTGSFNSSEEREELKDIKYLVDVNNDELLDIITLGSSEVNVYYGNYSGSYLLSQTLYPYNKGGSPIAKGDINGDGFIDLITRETYDHFNNSWRIFINDGTGKFIRDTVATNIENYITEANLVDMDKDDDLDLVLLNTWPSDPSTQFAGAYIYYNDGIGVFESYAQVPFMVIIPPYFDNSISDLRQLFVVDYDLNGLNDIAGFGSAEGGLIILHDAGGNFNGFDETMFGGAENFAFFTSGDIDGNNRLDLIVSNWQICPECGDSGEVRMENYLNFDPIDFWNDSSRAHFSLGKRNDVGVAVVPVLADVDNDGDLDVIHTGYPTTITYNENIITSVEEQDVLTTFFALSQNYPNPFNPSTTIKFTIPNVVGDAYHASRNTKLIVYDILGREIKTLLNKPLQPGSYEIEFDGSDLTSGVYFYVLETGGKRLSKKMLLVK